MVAHKSCRGIILALLLITQLTHTERLLAAEEQDTQIQYTVRFGDHLHSIALRLGTTVWEIQRANGLTNTVIHAGQSLLIPQSSTRHHLVRPGDNLFRISLAYGTTVSALQQANGLASSSIYVGQVLVLPGNTSAPFSVPPSLSNVEDLVIERPAPQGYSVLPGDNLFRISLRFGTTVGALQTANGLYSTLIFPGLQLIVPGARSDSSPQAPVAATYVPTTPLQTMSVFNTPVEFELGGQVERHAFGSAVTRMKDAGMTWVKFQVPWSPSYHASHRAHLISQAHERGFKVLLSTRGSPQHARESHFSEFASFAADLANLGADAIEVWNEPNLSREWESGHISPLSYTKLLRMTYQAIKDANPNTMVISAGPSPTGFFRGCGPEGCDDLPFIHMMVSEGALNYTDCVGIHYNEGLVSPMESYGDPRQNSGHYTRYYQTMVDTYWTAIGGERPLCFTDLGYLSGEEWGYLPEAYLWDPPHNLTTKQHARYLAEAARLSRDQGRVRLMIVFNVNVPGFDEDPMAGYSIVRPTGQCPACATLAAVVKQ